MALALLVPIRTAGAGTWAPLTPVRDQTTYDDNYPYLAADGSGTVWIVWSSVDPSFGDLEAYYSRWNGAGWDSARTVNPPNNIDDLIPRIAAANDGTPWVVWKIPDVANPPTYAGVASHWTGTQWSPPETIWTGGDRVDTYELAAASDRDLWVVKDGAVGSADDTGIWVYHLLNGVLDPPVTFTDPDSIDLNPRVAVDASGDPWVTWVKTPPLSPDWSRIVFSHRTAGGWSAPRSAAPPYEINRGELMADSDGTPWIICRGADPELGPYSNAVWARQWNGTDWTAPTRVSEPMTTSDSLIYQLSAARGYRQAPRAVWGRGNLLDYTRRDVVTSGWNGTSWGPDEIVGDLADSSDISWPTVTTTQDGRTWVAYMMPTKPSGRQRIVTTYSPYVPTLAASIELSVATTNSGVSIRWSVAGLEAATAIEVYRSPGPSQAPIPQFGSPGCDMMLALDGTHTSGESMDASPGCGTTQTYWLRAVRGNAPDAWSEPQTAHLAECAGPRLDRVTPNPARAEVKFLGSGAPSGAAVLDIFDVRGRLVATLKDPQRSGDSTVGKFEFGWKGTDRFGKRLAGGIYFARLRGAAESKVAVKRFALLRP